MVIPQPFFFSLSLSHRDFGHTCAYTQSVFQAACAGIQIIISHARSSSLCTARNPCAVGLAQEFYRPVSRGLSVVLQFCFLFLSRIRISFTDIRSLSFKFSSRHLRMFSVYTNILLTSSLNKSFILTNAGPWFLCHYHLNCKVQSTDGLMWHFPVNHL